MPANTTEVPSSNEDTNLRRRSSHSFIRAKFVDGLFAQPAPAASGQRGGGGGGLQSR